MKKIFLITLIGGFILSFVGFFVVGFFNAKSTPYSENVKENITKVSSTETDSNISETDLNINKTLTYSNIDAPLSFSYPVEGEIGLNYSPDSLVFSKTLNEWTTHNGIDIQAKRGTPVKAVEEGVVEIIDETASKGIEIIISHKDDYKSVYSNLSTKEMVQVGQKVEKGQVISGVGNTASFEYYEPEHVHFEMYKNNKSINPLDMLKKV